MVERLTGLLGDIADLDREIDDLKDQREERTDLLEEAALKYHEAHPERSVFSRLGCARCYFVFGGVRGDVVAFGSDCSYCGPGGGDRLTVTVEELAKLLP